MGNSTATCNFTTPVFYKNTGGDLTVEICPGRGPHTGYDLNTPTYLYLKRRGAGDAFIAAVPIPRGTRFKEKTVTFGQAYLVEGESYYCVWSTCSCPSGTVIATTPQDLQVTNLAYWRQQQAAAEEERVRQARIAAALRAQDEAARLEQTRIEAAARAEADRLRRIAEAEYIRKQAEHAAFENVQAALRREANGSVNWMRISEEEREVFRRAFFDIDRNHDGHITSVELHDYYQRMLGESLTHAEVQAMMTEADVLDHNGRIEIGEFCDITIRARNHDSSLKWHKLEGLYASEMEHAAKRHRGGL